MDSTIDAPKENSQSNRNRKRIFDHSEGNDEEGSCRRPHCISDYELLPSRGGPNKKGFIENEKPSSEVIDQRLADNLDDSLSGLGINMSTMPFNMNETMSLALPPVNFLKQENSDLVKVSPSYISSILFDEGSQGTNPPDRILKLLSLDTLSEGLPSPSLHHLLQQSVLYTDSDTNTDSPPLLAQCEDITKDVVVPAEEYPQSESPSHSTYPEDNRFQFVLSAPTSCASKINEESITYLNQGQSYEIKVKKLGDMRLQGKCYHSKIRVCFHERRLQFMEKEQIANWKQMRPSERILEVDVPLSYGVTEVLQDSKYLNICEFDWEPTKEVGVYIKVNCISTEFTPKKHGGEKGVPFRLQVENYCRMDGNLERLYVCASQIKVFKLKGADGKHKQDKERISKRPLAEQEKYRPQCECTILQKLLPEAVYTPPSDEDDPLRLDNASTPVSPTAEQPLMNIPSSLSINTSPDSLVASERPQAKIVPKLLTLSAETSISMASSSQAASPDPSHKMLYYNVPLHTSATSSQTQLWLATNRFPKHASIFSNFTASDLLRLSRNELKEICGLADGIRLFNALHAKSVIPRLTLYICCENEQLYNAVYLENLTWSEFVGKISPLIKIQPESVSNIYLQGPSDINILVNDEVIMNFEMETMMSVKILPGPGEEHVLLLKITNKGTNKDSAS